MERQTFVTLLLSVFIALLGIGIIIPIMPIFATDLGASGFALGMVIAAFAVSRSLLQPVVGNLSDRFGRKWFLVSGLAIYGLVGLLIPHARSVVDLIAIRAFHGVGSAMIVPIAMAYMSFLAPKGEEGRYMGYLNIAIFCGIGCGPVFGGFFNDRWGMSSAFNAMALLSGLACLLVVRKMPPHIPARGGMRPRLFASMVAMAKRRKTAGILLARYGTMILMVPTMAFLPLLMAEWPGVTGTQIGIVIAARTLVNAVFQVPFGKLADRKSKLMLLLLGTCWMTVAMLLVPQATTVLWMVLVYMLLGAGEAAIWPVLGAYASEEGREYFGHGTMMGVFSLAMSAGVFTGALLSGYAMDHLGMAWAYYTTALSVLAVTCGAMVFIAAGERLDRLEAHLVVSPGEYTGEERK